MDSILGGLLKSLLGDSPPAQPSVRFCDAFKLNQPIMGKIGEKENTTSCKNSSQVSFYLDNNDQVLNLQIRDENSSDFQKAIITKFVSKFLVTWQTFKLSTFCKFQRFFSCPAWWLCWWSSKPDDWPPGSLIKRLPLLFDASSLWRSEFSLSLHISAKTFLNWHTQLKHGCDKTNLWLVWWHIFSDKVKPHW